MKLIDIYNRYPNDQNSDKGYYHGYISLYNNLLENYRNCTVFCEVGVANGFSMRIWDEFFTEKTKIVGIDINLNYIKHSIKSQFSDRINLIESDVSNLKNTYLKDFNFDVVIDDGSHQLQHQIDAIDFFIPKINPGGMLIIEDVQSQENLDILAEKYKGYSININTKMISDDRVFIIIC